MEAELTGQLAQAGWVGVRVFVIASMQPIWRAGLGRLWLVVSFALAGGVGSLTLAAGTGAGAGAAGGVGPFSWLVHALAEAALGLVIGVLVSLPAHAFIGASVASAKSLRAAPAPLVALFVALVLMIGLGLGTHHLLLASLVDQVAVFPPGRPDVWLLGAHDLADSFVRGLTGLVAVGLAFATPVLLSQAVVHTVTGVLGRGPSAVGFIDASMRSWAAAAVSMMALGVSWSVLYASWADAALLPAGP